MANAFAAVIGLRAGAIPEVILPVQAVTRRATSPEHTLLLAVLEQALRDLDTARKGHKPWDVSRRSVAFRHEVIAWFRSDRALYVTDFVAICDVFGLDPDAVRKALGSHDWLALASPTHGVRVVCPGRKRVRR